MKLFWIIYLAACMVVIGKVLRNHMKSIKIKKNLDEESENECKNPNGDSDKNADLKFTWESVNSWLNNCDQKAGILLTVVGVAITVLITSDFLKYLRNYIFKPFMDYWAGNQDLSFSWGRFSLFVLLVIALAILIICCFYLFRAISANIDYDKMYKENPDLVKTSYIFYGTISRMKYEYFKNGGDDYNEDLKSQIYVNSQIATSKFENYNEGLLWFKVLLLVAVFLFVAIMFVK